jgi:hypothetical protein
MPPLRGIGRLTGAEVRASRARRHAADLASIIQSMLAAGHIDDKGDNRRVEPARHSDGDRQRALAGVASLEDHEKAKVGCESRRRLIAF